MVKRIMMLLMLSFGVAFISACANEEFWCDNCSQMYTGSMNRAAFASYDLVLCDDCYDDFVKWEESVDWESWDGELWGQGNGSVVP